MVSTGLQAVPSGPSGPERSSGPERCRGPHVRWIHRQAMRSITSVMPAMKDITAQAMNAISAITGPLEVAIGPTGSLEAPRSALLQGAEADQGPGSTARRAADAPAIARSGASIGAPGRHAERHVSPRGSSMVSGYGSVDPGSADRWRNTKLSRKYAPFVLARWAAQLSKNFGRKSGPPKFR